MSAVFDVDVDVMTILNLGTLWGKWAESLLYEDFCLKASFSFTQGSCRDKSLRVKIRYLQNLKIQFSKYHLFVLNDLYSICSIDFKRLQKISVFCRIHWRC